AARPRDPDARGGGALPAPQAPDHLQVGAGEAHPRGQAREGVALSPEHPGPLARRADAERRFRLPPPAPRPRAGLRALREPARPDAPAGSRTQAQSPTRGGRWSPALVPPGTATIGNILDCDVGEMQGTVTTFPGFSTPEPAAESRHGGSLINP